MDLTIPSKITKGTRHLPWISVQIKRLMRKRDKSYRKARRPDRPNYWSAFRKHRNFVAKIVAKAHRNYLNNTSGNSLTVNPKTFWNYVKLKRTENLGIPTLRNNNRMFTSDTDKADALNNQFQSVYTTNHLSSLGVSV